MLFSYRRKFLAALALGAIGLLASCSGGQSVESTQGMDNGQERAADEPILGVSSGPGMPLPECDPSIVESAPDPEDSNARITVSGQHGDAFSYELTTRDGDTIEDSSGALSPAQNGVAFNTGVAESNVHHVVISAKGRSGVDGKCVIHTGQRGVQN